MMTTTEKNSPPTTVEGAKLEIRQWMEQFRSLKTENERQAFAQWTHLTLGQRNQDELKANFFALKECIHELRLEVERKTQPTAVAQLEVFPKSEKEKTQLVDFLERKGILFKVAA